MKQLYSLEIGRPLFVERRWRSLVGWDRVFFETIMCSFVDYMMPLVLTPFCFIDLATLTSIHTLSKLRALKGLLAVTTIQKPIVFEQKSTSLNKIPRVVSPRAKSSQLPCSMAVVLNVSRRCHEHLIFNFNILLVLHVRSRHFNRTHSLKQKTSVVNSHFWR